MTKATNDAVSRSHFAVLPNPEDHGYSGSPEEICDAILAAWVGDSASRTAAVSYCVSATGFRHVHAVLEDDRAMRFSKVKAIFPFAHIEATRGSKGQALAYIEKRPPYDEAGEQVLCTRFHGQIAGAPGKRTDLQKIQDLLDAGLRPDEILRQDLSHRRFERLIREDYLDRLIQKTPPIREVAVHYLVGPSGSGKSYTYVELCKTHGRESIYLLTDSPTNGGLDRYLGEPILFWDEVKPSCGLSFSTLLQMLDVYPVQIHARYANAYALWSQVYLTSVYPPETLYEILVSPLHRQVDTLDQLLRRLTDVTYCERDPWGNFSQFTLPAVEYKGYEDLRQRNGCSGFFSTPLPLTPALSSPPCSRTSSP